MQQELARLEEMYTVFNPNVVGTVITDYPHLFPILADAYEHIVKVFGSHLVRAELRHETEEDDDAYEDDNKRNATEYLSILIKTNLPADKAHRLQDQFDDEWWLDVEEDMIVISVETSEQV
ncbi:MAG: hypothetical protein RML40_09665 [Bacteroidota bacterium]|nr:hypothetical protein [Candidatus Kapabacteria bacterium]MDW8220784.1 hypothetical protein [Bacteroidota bacterium]